jgi:hypothetical protein
MATNFNINPYWDDFDPDKNYHRILFKPGFAVQARELTQSQTILQNQITKFADHIFQKNTPVDGAQITFNKNCFFLKLKSTFLGASVNVDDFLGKVIRNTVGDVQATVIAVAAGTGSAGVTIDPPTLVVSYLSGQTFADVYGESDIKDIYFLDNPNPVAQLIEQDFSGPSSVASISRGVFYVVAGTNTSSTTGEEFSVGHFVTVQEQTTILDKYSNNPSLRVGLNITESIFDFTDDVSLLDPANGAPNFQGPGADRYTINLVLETRPLDLGDDSGFIELLRVKDGIIEKQVSSTSYSAIDDYFAKRTYDTNGDYVVDDFKLTTSANTANADTYTISIGKGVAYVRGYRVENQSNFFIENNRARETELIDDNNLYINYGNFVYINSVNGVFDIAKNETIDLHAVTSSNVSFGSLSNYSTSWAGTAMIRSIELDRASNTQDSSTFEYKLHVANVQFKSISTTVSSSANTSTVTLSNVGSVLSAANSAYVHSLIAVTSGPGAGDVRTITSYDGVSKIVTVDQPFSTPLTSSSNVSIRFNENNINSVIKVNGSYNQIAKGDITTSSKENSQLSGKTFIGDKESPELIFQLGEPFVSGVANSSYSTTITYYSQSLSTGGTNITLDVSDRATFLSSDKDDYIIVQSNGAILAQNLYSISRTNGNRTVTITTTSNLTNTTVIAKISVNGVSDLNNGLFFSEKDLYTANTTQVFLSGTTINTNTKITLTEGQCYVLNAYDLNPQNPITLYVSDVKRIVKVIDTQSPTVVPTNAMLSNPTFDVTSNYVLDNGQRDTHYDHASIRLLRGRQKAKGQLLVLFDYYDHSLGNGFFNVNSYISSTRAENYLEIPSYTSSSGVTYNLRDCVDFRPARTNLQTSFVFGGSGAYAPLDKSSFINDYSFYLGRRDKLVLNKDKNFQIIQGTPSRTPIYPKEPDGSLVLANLDHLPYTGTVPGERPGVLPDLSIEKLKHKRWTMKDISGMETRVNNIEYYTALNLLEKSAQDLQVPDVFGINRFKNGILVDDFSSFATSDSSNVDYSASINNRTKQMSASHIVDNFPLQSQLVANTFGQISSFTEYVVHSVGKGSHVYTLPYTIANVATQVLASNTVNVNPFATPLYDGFLDITPPVDNWVDNTRLPDLLIVDPNLQLYVQSNTLNTLNTTDWKVIPGTETTKVSSSQRRGTVTEVTSVYASQSQDVTLGNYSKLDSNFTTGGFISDLTIQPFIRPQDVLIRAKGLATNTPIKCWFDGVRVDQFMVSPDYIELKNVVGTFSEDDVIGFMDEDDENPGSVVFVPTGTVTSIYNYPGQNKVRLGVMSRVDDTINNTDLISQSPYIGNSKYDVNGAYVANTAYGEVVTSGVTISISNSGLITTVGGQFVDANGNNKQLQKISHTNDHWSNFLKKSAVWFTENNGRSNSGNIAYNVYFPSAGTYTVRFAASTYGNTKITINSTQYTVKQLPTNATLSNWKTDNANTNVVIPAEGTYKLEYDLTFIPNNNKCGVRGFGSTISNNTTGEIIFDTATAANSAFVPSGVGTVTDMFGGGKYYTGVTTLRLSGLASDINNYYINSTISVKSTYVTSTPTGKPLVLPKTMTSRVVNYNANTKIVTLESGVDCSLGFNTQVNGDLTSSYNINGTANNYLVSVTNSTEPAKLSTDESGEFTAVFSIPANTFRTGEKVFRIDNRTIDTDDTTFTTIAKGTFSASGLSVKSQAIEFSPSISSAKKSFVQTSTRNNQLISQTSRQYNRDPLCQSFLIDGVNYPNGVFLRSVKFFFNSKPTTTQAPINLSIVGTLNGYPNGETLDNSIVTYTPDRINVSANPHYLDSSSWTEFVFPAPVYIQPETLYAFMLQTESIDYNVYIASKNAIALPSTVKNNPTDPTPTSITKISVAPYVGSLFESQNALTWSAQQGKALMFVMDRCVFETTSKTVDFIIPKNLPYRKLISQDIRNYWDPDFISNLNGDFAGANVESHAYNVTTTDFVPSQTNIRYSYISKLKSGGFDSEKSITPGKYACPSYDDTYLDDGLGERLLVANESGSFRLNAVLSTSDNTVSPVISDDGLSLYNTQWNINNLGLSNDSIILVNGGTGYNQGTVTVTISNPDFSGEVAAAQASVNTSTGIIESIYITNLGSGYVTTPTITVSDPTTRSGNANAVVSIAGETSSQGGNALARYITKKVVLTPRNDSGDLRVFFTAYRPFGTDIHVYYKIQNRNDSDVFEDIEWQLMTMVDNQNFYSTNRNNLIEYQAAPGINNVANNNVEYTDSNGVSHNTFNQYSIKIVLSTNDKTRVPFLSDLRTLALPSGTGI